MGIFEKMKTKSAAAGVTAVVVLAVILAATFLFPNQSGGGMANTPTSTTDLQVNRLTESVKPTETEPDAIVEETEPTETEPDATVEETEPTETEPDVTVGETEPTETEPDATVGETEPTETEPDATVEETEPTETEPDATVGETEPTELTEPAETAPAETEPPKRTEPEESTTPGMENAIGFPLSMEDGKLEIGSLFASTGINPDCSNQEGRNVATIALTNTSGAMLVEVAVTAALADGTEICFYADYLPAGKTAMVFSADNVALAGDAICVDVSAEAAWDETGYTAPEGISASADGMMVTVKNDTAKDIPELIVYCRVPLGEDYFGGIAYEYKVTDLPANGSAAFMAIDCILGLAEVVKIEAP